MKKTLNRYSHIIWDWNGTLFDDSSLTLSIMNGMLSRRGRPSVSKEKYAELFDFPVSDYYRQIGWDFEKYSFESLSDEFIEEYYRRHRECPLRQGAEEILRANKVPQSILTASKQTDIDLLVKHFGLDGLFAGVNGLNNHHAAGKLEIGRKWVKELNVAPENILMVGDTTHDAVLAKELGMDCVLIESGHQNKERLEKCSVPVIRNLKELVWDKFRL
jgi:phosphoglycolate phosphatase